MFVMHLMSTTDSSEICIVCFPEKFKSLVNKNVMHQEVTHAIKRDSKANPEQVIKVVLHSKKQSCDSWQGKNQKEKVIVFKETR
jgi:hypothetical protein